MHFTNPVISLTIHPSHQLLLILMLSQPMQLLSKTPTSLSPIHRQTLHPRIPTPITPLPLTLLLFRCLSLSKLPFLRAAPFFSLIFLSFWNLHLSGSYLKKQGHPYPLPANLPRQWLSTVLYQCLSFISPASLSTSYPTNRVATILLHWWNSSLLSSHFYFYTHSRSRDILQCLYQKEAGFW